MQTVQTLLSARYVLPVDADNAVFENYSIAIDNGRIVAIQPTQQAHEQFNSHTHIEYPEHILILQ